MSKLVLVDHEGRLLSDYKPATPSPEVIETPAPTADHLAFMEAEKSSTPRKVNQ